MSKKTKVLAEIVASVLTFSIAIGLFATKISNTSARGSGLFPFGYLYDEHITEYSELTDANAKMAWAIYYICESFQSDDTPLEWIEDMTLGSGDMTQEFWDDWGQYLVAYRLLDDMVDGEEKEAMLSWAKKKGYWKEDYVAPYDKFNMETLKNTYHIYGWCYYAARLTDLATDDITEQILPNRKFSDYEFYYFVSIEKGIFGLDYNPSTIKWNKDKPSYPFLYSDNDRYAIYYSKKLNKWVGFGYTDEVTQKVLTEQNAFGEPHGMAGGLWTEEQYNFIKYMDYGMYSMFHDLCNDTETSLAWAKENWESIKKDPYYSSINVTELREGWQYGKDAPEYILEFLAETDNPYLKESKYKGWYENWLKNYKGTAGNYELLTGYNEDYEEWYAAWLKENKPGVTMGGKKASPTATPTPTQIPIDHTEDVNISDENDDVIPTPTPTPLPSPEDVAEELSVDAEDGSHVHEYVVNILEDSTCAKEGIAEYICGECGDIQPGVVPKKDHQYELIDFADATCEYDGYEKYECSECHDIQTVITETATGHFYEITDRKEATCTEDGYEITECQNCHDVQTEILVSDGHQWITTDLVEATCTTEGYETKYCPVCETTETSPIPKKAHTEAERVVKEAGFFTNGEKEIYCSECGEIIRTEKIPMESPAPLWLFAVVGAGVAGIIVTVIVTVAKKKNN